MWSEVVIGVAGIFGTLVAGLGAPILANRRARGQRDLERRTAAYAACIQRWRQVESHVGDPRSAASMVRDGRLDDLWALAADVELHGSPAVARRADEVTTRLIAWAVATTDPTGVDGPQPGFPTAEIAGYTAAARADLRGSGGPAGVSSAHR